jgi:hypothetical protein
MELWTRELLRVGTEGGNMKYRTKLAPVEVEAVRWDGDAKVANRLIGERYGVDWEYASASSSDIFILDRFRSIRCRVGDYIIRNAQGKVYSCEADIFEQAHEPVNESEA